MTWYNVTAAHTEMLEVEVKAEDEEEAIEEACRMWGVDGDLDDFEVEEAERV